MPPNVVVFLLTTPSTLDDHAESFLGFNPKKEGGGGSKHTNKKVCNDTGVAQRDAHHVSAASSTDLSGCNLISSARLLLAIAQEREQDLSTRMSLLSARSFVA